MSKMIRCRRDYDHLCICANRGAILFTLQMENHGKGKTVMSSSNLWKKWASGSLFAQSTLPVCSQQEKGKGSDEQDLGYKKPKAKKRDTIGLFFCHKSWGSTTQKEKTKEDIQAPENSWRQPKRSFLSSKWVSETILQKPKDLVIFHSSARKSVICFPSITRYLTYPNKTSISSFPFLPAVFLTVPTER